MDFKYKVGDRVRVRSDLRRGAQYFMATRHENDSITDVATEEMVAYAGKIVTIRSYWRDKKYEIEGCDYKWVDGMFDGIVIEDVPAKPFKPVTGELKPGDKVKIRPDLKGGDSFAIHVNGTMERKAGEIVQIKKRLDDRNGVRVYKIEPDAGEWNWTEDLFVLNDVCEVDSHGRSIIITSDGKKTTAVYKDGEKTREAFCRCSPNDTFDFAEGAKIAFSRLWEDDEEDDTEEVGYDGKVICIQRGYGASAPVDNFTVGKIYTVSDGHIKGDRMESAGKYYSLEMLCLGMGHKFIPLVE